MQQRRHFNRIIAHAISNRETRAWTLSSRHERIHLAFVGVERHTLTGVKLSKPRFDLSPVPGVGIQPRLHGGGGNGFRRLALAGRQLRQPLGVTLG